MADKRRGFKYDKHNAELEIHVNGTEVWRSTADATTITPAQLGFYGVSPVAKPSAYTQTYAVADKTHAAMTSSNMPAGGAGTAAGGWDTAANRDTAIADFAELRADVIDLKQLVNSLIDDLQALGLVG